MFLIRRESEVGRDDVEFIYIETAQIMAPICILRTMA